MGQVLKFGRSNFFFGQLRSQAGSGSWICNMTEFTLDKNQLKIGGTRILFGHNGLPQFFFGHGDSASCRLGGGVIISTLELLASQRWLWWFTGSFITWHRLWTIIYAFLRLNHNWFRTASTLGCDLGQTSDFGHIHGPCDAWRPIISKWYSNTCKIELISSKLRVFK